MVKFNLPNESFNYSFEAHKVAQQAGNVANVGMRYRQQYYECEMRIRKWQEYMVNAPIVLHNTLFTLFFVVDIIFSWHIIEQMLAEVKIIKLDSGELLTQIVSVTCTLLVCLLINAWAAATAHFIGKGWSKEIQDWERWNFAFIKQNNDLPYNVIDGIMQQEIKRARRLSWFSGIILMLVILFIAYFRIMALLITENLSGMALIISVVMTALPIALILGELITGDYIWYTIRWLQMRKSRDHFYNNFLAAKKQCGELDQLAMQYTESAKKRGEPVQVIGDLENCHLRIKHRTQSRDDYMEPFENWRRIGFTFKVRKNQRPLANAKTFGVLPNGAKTGDYHTDSDGKTTLYWSGDFDHLISISIYNREYLGPFQSDAEHYIDVPEEVALSANGHDTEGMVFDN